MGVCDSGPDDHRRAVVCHRRRRAALANNRVAVWRGERWQTVAWGTTIGNARLHDCARATAARLRVVVEFADAAPALKRVPAYLTPDAKA